MAEKSKYYYLKIKENFFDTEDMKLLESMDNGYVYSNILMKMYLLSLKNNGKLMYKDKIPYNSKMLSTILNHNVDILDKAILIFKELNLIEILDTGAIFMLDIQNYIGKSSDEADRKREYRKQIDTEKGKILIEDKCPTNVRTNCANIRDKDKDIDYSSSSSSISNNINYSSSSNINNNINNNSSNINNNNNILNNIYSYVETNFMRILTPLEINKIQEWIELYGEDIIKYAVELSVFNGKKTFNYVDGILKNWKGNNLITLDEIKEYNEKLINKKTNSFKKPYRQSSEEFNAILDAWVKEGESDE